MLQRRVRRILLKSFSRRFSTNPPALGFLAARHGVDDTPRSFTKFPLSIFFESNFYSSPTLESYSRAPRAWEKAERERRED